MIGFQCCCKLIHWSRSRLFGSLSLLHHSIQSWLIYLNTIYLLPPPYLSSSLNRFSILACSAFCNVEFHRLTLPVWRHFSSSPIVWAQILRFCPLFETPAHVAGRNISPVSRLPNLVRILWISVFRHYSDKLHAQSTQSLIIPRKTRNHFGETFVHFLYGKYILSSVRRQHLRRVQICF